MKKIIVIIRNERVQQSKVALENLGINGVAVLRVSGQGRQKYPLCTTDPEFSLQQDNCVSLKQKPGLNTNRHCPADPVPIKREFKRGFLPKTMLIMIVSKEEVLPVVHALITANQSGSHGDGKIYICPIVTALDIRNNDPGIIVLP
ncbi:MAG: P-II family nitrogen regulator [Methanoregula sp.]|nr:P-II family nitrogen regulator [Methanoregula sp.]